MSHTLFIVTGMPAVGKTTFAATLAMHKGACLIDIDTATEPIVKAAMKELVGDADDRDSPLFKKVFREAIYETLFAIADENLSHSDVVLTGPFTKELKNTRWKEDLAEKIKNPCKIKPIFLYCNHELRKRRLLERSNPRDTQKLENWEENLRYYDLDSRPAYPHISIDTGEADAASKAIAAGLIERAD